MSDPKHEARNAAIKAWSEAFMDHGPGITVVLTIVTMADWIGKLDQ